MAPHLRRIIALASVTALLGCAEPKIFTVVSPPGQPPQPEPLDDAALRALYASPHREDGTVIAGSHQGAQWTKWTKPDGGLELLAGHGLFADSGTYEIRDNMICSKWSHIDGGKESCMRVIQVSSDEYMTLGTDGKQGSRFHIAPP
jgi:hypothetical protein